MEPTRRWWGGVAAGGLFVGLAALLARPLLLVGAAGIGAWLCAHAYRFGRATRRVAADLDVEQRLARERALTDEPATVELAARLPGPSPLDLELQARPPVSAAGPDPEERACRLDAGGTEATTAFRVTVRVAGRARFDAPTVTARDPRGFFRTRFSAGPAPALTVEPRTPEDLHVGEGGEELAAPFGDHSSGRLGSGLDPAELREYVPGDSADRIDWKATARLGEPYIREFEAETDRRTALVFDRRAAMGTGLAGATKLDYLREVALVLVRAAREFDDPLGYYAVGDAGLTDVRPPAADRGHYNAIRSRLHDLAPTAAPRTATAPGLASPGWARRTAARLDADTPYGASLRPFLASARTYVERVEDRPLFRTARVHLSKLVGRTWTVLFTDDTERAELRETVKAARRGDDRVLVYLAPTVLYEAGGLADLETAYERYLEFERFRRELAAMPRIAAREVAPGDRLAALLDRPAGGQRARRARADGGEPRGRR